MGDGDGKSRLERRTEAITDGVLSGSTFESVRMARWSWFKEPVPQKLRWSALIVLAVSLMPLTVFLFPADTIALPLAERAAAAPVVLVLGYFLVALEVVAALAMFGLVLYRLHIEPDISRHKALELLAMEDVASLVAYGTGGFGTLLLLVFFGMGLVGRRALEAFVALGGSSPFALSELPLTTLQFIATGVLVASLLMVLAEVTGDLMRQNEFVPDPAAF
jgi:hypothetical protein